MNLLHICLFLLFNDNPELKFTMTFCGYELKKFSNNIFCNKIALKNFWICKTISPIAFEITGFSNIHMNSITMFYNTAKYFYNEHEHIIMIYLHQWAFFPSEYNK